MSFFSQFSLVSPCKTSLFSTIGLMLATSSFAQTPKKPSTTEVVYQQLCASCHGKEMEGGMGSAFIDGKWVYGDDVDSIASIIKHGKKDAAMPSFKDALSDEQINMLSRYILSAKVEPSSYLNSAKATSAQQALLTQTFEKHEGKLSAAGYGFSLEKLVEMDEYFWSIEIMPDESLLLAQHLGKLWHFKDGELNLIEGTPSVRHKGQGGLLDVKLHPEYAQNGWVYMSYSEDIGAKKNFRQAGMTAVVRGKIKNNKWQDQETIFSVDKKFHTASTNHYGSRFVFQNGYVYFTIGDRAQRESAQALGSPNGKIIRLHDDGRVPKDNPFVNDKSALPYIWSYGHRNPQGLTIQPSTGLIWSAEHGPKGGDELNLIERGKNYGWPVITFGRNYSGTKITDQTSAPGMEQPKTHWTPSIAVSSIDFVEGDMFAKWSGRLLVASLKYEQLNLLEIDKDNNVLSDTVILKDYGRVRDVIVGPNGAIYLSVQGGKSGKSEILKMVRQ